MPAFGPAFNAIESASAPPPTTFRIRSRVFADLALRRPIGIWIAFALFLVIALVRHTRFLAHDLRHAFNEHLPPWMAMGVLVPALGFPILFGLGPLPLLAWISLVLWTRFLPRERIVTGAFLAFGMLTPAIASQIGNWLAFDSGLEGRLHSLALENAADARGLADLTAEAEATRDPICSSRSPTCTSDRALRNRRVGVSQGGGSGSRRIGGIGIGLARYGQGDEPGAIAAFDRAIAADSNDVAAHFNLSQIYAERTELDKSQTNLHAAKAVDCAELRSAARQSATALDEAGQRTRADDQRRLHQPPTALRRREGRAAALARDRLGRGTAHRTPDRCADFSRAAAAGADAGLRRRAAGVDHRGRRLPPRHAHAALPSLRLEDLHRLRRTSAAAGNVHATKWQGRNTHHLTQSPRQ